MATQKPDWYSKPKEVYKPEWYDAIENDVITASQKCDLAHGKGLGVSKPNIVPDRYSYRDLDAFKKAQAAHLKANNFRSCIKIPDHLLKSMDKFGRYYKGTETLDECRKMGKEAVWEWDAPNRENKYGHGVCWKNLHNKQCGFNTDKTLFNPEMRKKLPNVDKTIESSRNKCRAGNDCRWDDVLVDCMPKDNKAVERVKQINSKEDRDMEKLKLRELSRRVKNPPAGMPADVTKAEAAIQNYLLSWYKYNQPGVAPLTDELEGTGNRCVEGTGKATKNDDISNNIVNGVMFSLNNLYEKEELKQIPFVNGLLSKHFRNILNIAIGKPNVKKLSDLWMEHDLARDKGNQVAVTNAKNFINLFWTEIHDLYAGIDDIESYDNYYEYIDPKKPPYKAPKVAIASSSKAPEKEFMPSLPQSVINMIMKNIASHGSTNRGIMGWHSTGSGKTCTASGVFDAFWDTNKQIVFASSIDAIASNPDYKFHECAKRLFPRFKEEPFNGDMETIGQRFAERGIIFISFAKLANRILKMEKLKEALEGKYSVTKTKIKMFESDDEDMPPPAKKGKKAVVEETDSDSEVVVPKKKTVAAKGKRKVVDDSDSDSEEEYVKPQKKVAKKSKASTPIKKSRKKVVETESESEEEYVKPQKGRKLAPPKVVEKVVSKKKVAVVVEKSRKLVPKKGKQVVVDDSDDEDVWATPMKLSVPKKGVVAAKSKGTRGRKVVDEEDVWETAQSVTPVKRGKGRKATRGGAGTTALLPPMDAFVARIAAWYGKSPEHVRAAMKKAEIKKVDDVVDLDHAVLVIDEVHNLFRPLPNQREKHALVEKHIVNPVMHPDLKVVILTATPGDNVTDVMKLLNIIRDPTHPVIKPPNADSAEDVMRFKHEVRGLVSYFDMSYDKTKFPTVVDPGPVRYPMSTKQFAAYIEKYKEVKADVKDYDKLAKANKLRTYWQGARKYSNMLYSFDKNMALTEFSSKLPGLLEKVQAYPTEKQYCYSAFYTNQGSGQGILEIARQMEKLGYEKLTVKEAREANKRGNVLAPKKRYILAIQSEIGEEGSTSAGVNLHEMVSIYNSEANKSGELVHMFLASQGFNEGLDLKAVRHIHIFEPLVTMASDLQTIGRARRFCSHAHLDQKDWTVQIHRYFSEFPVDVNVTGTSSVQMEITDLKGIIGDLEDRIKATKDKDEKKALKDKLSASKKLVTSLNKQVKSSKATDTTGVLNIDEYVYNMAQSKMKELFVTYHCMKEAAVDCRLLSDFHSDGTIHCLDDPVVFEAPIVEKKQVEKTATPPRKVLTPPHTREAREAARLTGALVVENDSSV